MNKHIYILLFLFLLLSTGCENKTDVICKKIDDGVFSEISGVFLNDKLYSMGGYIKQDINDTNYDVYDKLYSIVNSSYLSYGFETTIEKENNFIKLNYNVTREKIAFLDKDIPYVVDMSIEDFENINVSDGFICE